MTKHNEYLKQIENYLNDLEVMERAKLLSEINSQIIDSDTRDLEDPLLIANKKRVEHGFYPYKHKEKPSFLRFFLKLSAIMTIIVMSFIGIIIWKFTPVFHVDEEKNRVIILGGLIDIDGKAGRFKVGDQYQFTEAKYENEFQAQLNLSQEQDEIIIEFNSGAFNIKTTEDTNFQVSCKLETQPTANILENNKNSIEIDFTKMEGSSCDLIIPSGKKLSLEGKSSNIDLIEPTYNTYIEVDSANIQILPAPETIYKFDIEVKNGHIGQDLNKKPLDQYDYELNIELENGSVVLK